MRGLSAAACLGLATLLGAGTAAAAPAVLTAEGKCEIEINSGGIGAGDQCQRLTLKEDPASGKLIVIFDFASGMTIELQGSAIRVGSWLMMSPAGMRWTNAGGKPQEISNPAGEPNPQITGRCANALQAEGTQLYETHCRVQTPMGEIHITFKLPRTDKPKD